LTSSQASETLELTKRPLVTAFYVIAFRPARGSLLVKYRDK